MVNESGTLYIVATPVGNLQDITLRAIETLKKVDVIACEDTRRTQKLLNHFEISKKTIRYDEHSHNKASKKIIEFLEKGNSVALVSNAGTPAISDPGSRLVSQVYKSGFRVIPIPGASVVVSALSISGFKSDSFVFLGFLPKKKGKRIKILEETIGLNIPVVIFLPPRNLNKKIEELIEIFGDVKATFCRELTKLHETVITGDLSLIKRLTGDTEKGEITLVLNVERK